MTQLEKEEIKKILQDTKDYETKYKEIFLGIMVDIRDNLNNIWRCLQK